jgi:hypothetical protein
MFEKSARCLATERNVLIREYQYSDFRILIAAQIIKVEYFLCVRKKCVGVLLSLDLDKSGRRRRGRIHERLN